MALIKKLNIENYGNSRNQITYQTTQLSKELTHGIISTSDVRDKALAEFGRQAKSFIFQLAWRDYFQLCWFYYGDQIFSDIKSKQDFSNIGIPQKILTASTGIDILDQAIGDLINTGYLHNHARMWLASYITNLSDCHWKSGADWMYYYLLDGDPASNYLSWQWIAGTFSTKRYIFNQENINKYSDSNQSNTPIDLSYEEISNLKLKDEFAVFRPANFLDKFRSNSIQVSQLNNLSKVYLLTPFTLAKHQKEQANKVLFVDEDLFSICPIGENRYQLIENYLRDLGEYEVLVCDKSAIKEMSAKLEYIAHPSLAFLGCQSDYQLMFPDVEWKPKSFFNYWKRIENKYF